MPDDAAGAGVLVDAQAALPAGIFQHQRAGVVEHLLDRPARLPGPRQARGPRIVAGGFQFHAVHHHPAQRADPPVRLQGEAEQAVAVILVVAAQVHFQGASQPRVEAHVPVLDVQLPAHHYPAFVGVGLQQAPLALARPAMLGPLAFRGMAAEPRPAHRNPAADRRGTEARPVAAAPQQRAFALRLEMQQLRALAAEHGLAQWMIDQQQVAALEAHPVEWSLGPHGMKEALQRMLEHVRMS
ncbi:hypothetical protein D9M71_215940 [compost metagenome]